MKTTVSIGRYIGIQIAIIIVVLIIIYSLKINQVYHWGIYDTTHYFLSLEGDKVLESIQLTGKLPPEPNPYIHYFHDISDLPDFLLSRFPTAQHQDGELLSYETLDMAVYLLPYENPDTGRLFYVSHTYQGSEDDYSGGIDISELLFLLALGTFVIVALLVKNIAWSIITPVRLLETWATSITPDEKERGLLTPAQLKFTELHAVAERLNTSVVTIEHHNQREKNFLRTLSHELGTPLAIVKAALELFDKKSDKLDEGDRKKLDRIRRANNNMQSTTECLLWLWKGKEKALPKEEVYLHSFVQDVIAVNAYLLQRKSVDVLVDIPEELVFRTERKLLEMVVTNLIRNAFQYTEQGRIQVAAEFQQITVNNPLLVYVSEKGLISPSSVMPGHEESNYGYGVGLYLVENLCAHQGWTMDIHRTEQLFSVSIILELS
ncbi:sensor histidine kinase [Algicola sagamiensis]|uniref:sensor histidine kinase n=1 Tax=Algicola sagamiensis TaxID=163869 RepID=UPI00037B2E54|nr:HAMP domain-containing sensor histidine kinase [Algicola sagamiensis]